MLKTTFDGRVDPADFASCAEVVAHRPESWPDAVKIIREASKQYRVGMALYVVEISEDFELQKRAAELALEFVEITPDTVDKAVKELAQEIRQYPNGEKLLHAIRPKLLELYRRGDDPAMKRDI
jgi:hypothetical protein